MMLGSILILTEGYKPDSASMCCSHSIILMQQWHNVISFRTMDSTM